MFRNLAVSCNFAPVLNLFIPSDLNSKPVCVMQDTSLGISNVSDCLNKVYLRFGTTGAWMLII